MKHKQYISKTEADTDERTITAVISTACIDRDGEVVSPKGADFTHYVKNPVVLWAHDYSGTPIGKARWIGVHPKSRPHSIKAQIEFANTPKAEEVFNLFKDGFLNAFSIGFIPKKGHSPTPDDIKGNPELVNASYIHDNWELLEFSAVPVPANPEALMNAVRAKTITISEDTIKELGVEIEEEVEPEIIEPEEIEDDPVVEPEIIVTQPVIIVPTPVVLSSHSVTKRVVLVKHNATRDNSENILIRKRLRGRIY